MFQSNKPQCATGWTLFLVCYSLPDVITKSEIICFPGHSLCSVSSYMQMWQFVFKLNPAFTSDYLSGNPAFVLWWHLWHLLCLSYLVCDSLLPQTNKFLIIQLSSHRCLFKVPLRYQNCAFLHYWVKGQAGFDLYTVNMFYVSAVIVRVCSSKQLKWSQYKCTQVNMTLEDTSIRATMLRQASIVNPPDFKSPKKEKSKSY